MKHVNLFTKWALLANWKDMITVCVLYYLVMVPGVEGTEGGEVGGDTKAALFAAIFASAEMLFGKDDKPKKVKKTTTEVVMEMNGKARQVKKEKKKRRNFSNPEDLRQLRKAISFMTQINESDEKCTVTEGPDGQSIFMHDTNEVSEVTGVKVSTIRKAMPENIDKYHKKLKVVGEGEKEHVFGTGLTPSLGVVGENQLVDWIEDLYARGWPPEWWDVHAAALAIAQHQGNLNFKASNGWRARFIKRHPEVCTRVVENLHRTRVGGLNVDNVKEYYDILKNVVTEVEKANGHALLPDEMLNIDETGFDLENCSKTQRVVIKTSKHNKNLSRKPQHQGSADRTHFSAAICIDASGHRYPTHFCSTGDIKPFLMPNTECIGTANGYYTDQAFET